MSYASECAILFLFLVVLLSVIVGYCVPRARGDAHQVRFGSQHPVISQKRVRHPPPYSSPITGGESSPFEDLLIVRRRRWGSSHFPIPNQSNISYCPSSYCYYYHHPPPL